MIALLTRSPRFFPVILGLAYWLPLLFELTGAFASESPTTHSLLPPHHPLPTTTAATTSTTVTNHDQLLLAPIYLKGDIDFSQIDYIFSDMDGTLLRSNHQMSPRTIQAIQSIQKKGKKFFPATGRNRRSFGGVINPSFLQLYGESVEEIPGIYSQGLCVYGMNGQLIHEESLEFPLIHEIEHYLQSHSLSYIGYSRDRVFTSNYDHFIEEIIKYKDPIPELLSKTITKVNHLGLKINKIILLADESTILYHRPILEKLFLGKITFTRAVPGMLEMLPFGSSKGKGLLKFLEYHQIDPSKVMAFGDAENDLEMIKLVKYGIAMKNAKEDLFRYAYRRTFHTNEEDGVAHILEYLLDE